MENLNNLSLLLSKKKECLQWKGVLFIPFLFASLFTPTIAKSQVNATIDFSESFEVSPLIFGYNQDHSSPSSTENWGSHRLGGNRMSTFNWETNDSNAGHDFNSYTNDKRIPNLIGVPQADNNKPGEAYRVFHQQNLDGGVTSIITMPIMGWVAADDNGPNTTGPSSNRWKDVSFEKGGQFSLNPNKGDNNVYLDEAMNWLVNEFGDATTSTGVKYVALGNEPSLWDHTHQKVLPTQVEIDDYINKVIESAKAIKSVDPNVKIIAGSFVAFRLFDFEGSDSDWNDNNKYNGYEWFLSYFLDKMQEASGIEGVNLIDILSFHYYPESRALGQKVNQLANTSAEVREIRMDFSRSLWDSTYIESSWITGQWSLTKGKPYRILKRVQETIAEYYPGLDIMIGEWDYGFDTDISHGVATADALGVFVNEDVEITNRWDLSPDANNGNDGTYTESAYKIFRNYDGNNGRIGDKAWKTSFTDPKRGSVWVTSNSNHDTLHIIAINKHQDFRTEFNIQLSQEHGCSYEYLEAYGFDYLSDNLKQIPNSDLSVSISSSNELSINPKRLSVTHMLVKQNCNPVTGLANSNNEEVLKIYPNPTTGTVQLSSEELYEIFDVNGKKVLDGRGDKVNLEFLEKGLYFLQVNQKSYRVVKE